MKIRPLIWPERPASGQTVVLIGERGHPSTREQLRLLENQGCLSYLVEKPVELQPRWFVGVPEILILQSKTASPEMVESVMQRLEGFTKANTLGMLEGIAR